MITVPWFDNHDLNKNNESIGKVNFLFCWTNNENEKDNRYLSFEMNDGFTLFYTGFGCYHRQCKMDSNKFWNYASYQNSKYFSNMRRSLIRCMSDIE